MLIANLDDLLFFSVRPHANLNQQMALKVLLNLIVIGLLKK